MPTRVCGTTVAAAIVRAAIWQTSLIPAIAAAMLPAASDRVSGLPLPAAALVSLPVRDIEAAILAIAPGRPGGGRRFFVVAVENQHHAFVLLGVARQRCAIDNK